MNVNVEEKATGEIAISGGYSNRSGWLSEAALPTAPLMGRGSSPRPR